MPPMSDSLIQGLASAKEQTIREILNQICTRFPETRGMAEEMYLAEERKSQIAKLSKETGGVWREGEKKSWIYWPSAYLYAVWGDF